jgi:L-ascorbate metabolism protein UlaG (beta-lactamase superfamily)
MVGESLPKDVADILLISHDHADHSNKAVITGAVNREKTFVIDKEGEYEIAGVLITALKTYHDKVEGAERGKNLVFSIKMDGLNMVHLGDIGHKLSNGQIEKLGNVDILMLPVGGEFTIDTETALEIVKDVSPGFVVPMHYKTDKASEGLSKLTTLAHFLEKNKFPTTAESVHKIKLEQSSLPDDTQVLLMNV